MEVTYQTLKVCVKHEFNLRLKEREVDMSFDHTLGDVVSLELTFPSGAMDEPILESNKISSKIIVKKIVTIPSYLNIKRGKNITNQTFYLKIHKQVGENLTQLWKNLQNEGGEDGVKVGQLVFNSKGSIAILQPVLLLSTDIEAVQLKTFRCSVVIDWDEAMQEISDRTSQGALIDKFSSISDEPPKKRSKVITGSDGVASHTRRGEEQHQASSHYNELVREQATRHLSLIFHLRKLNNLIKSELIESTMALYPGSTQFNVIDFGAGKGGDMYKWFRPRGR